MQPFLNPNYMSWASQQNVIPSYQQMNIPTIRGRMIASVQEITANDVPMDGTQAVFVKTDGSEIYTKAWNSDGTIATRIYIPKISAQDSIVGSEDAPVDTLSNTDIKAEFEAIRGHISEIEKVLKEMSPKRTSKVKENESESNH